MMKTLMSGDLNVMSCRSGWINVHLIKSRHATQLLNFAGRSVEEEYIAVNLNPLSHPFVEVISLRDKDARPVIAMIEFVTGKLSSKP